MPVSTPILWWVAQNAAASAVMAGVVWLVCRWRRPCPAWRHALWLIVLLKMLTPPLVAWPWKVPSFVGVPSTADDVGDPAPAAAAVKPGAAAGGPAREDASPRPTRRTDAPSDDRPAKLERAEPRGATDASAPPRPGPARRQPAWGVEAASRWAVSVIVAGGCAFAALQLLRVARVCALLRRAAPAGPDLRAQVERAAGELGLPFAPTRVVSGIDSPMVFCLVRPRLLWPAGLSAGAGDGRARAMIAHELSHLARRDHWVGWLELAAGCAWWWNPLYWYVRRQLRESGELACDARVIDALPGGRRAYAEALIDVCERMSRSGVTRPIPALGVATGDRRFLERRLTMILRERVPSRLRPIQLIAVALVAVATAPAWSQRAAPDAAGVDQPGQDRAPLPAAARAVKDRYEGEVAAAQSEAERRVAARRRAAIDELRAVAERYESEGRAAEAAAARAEVGRLSAVAAYGPDGPAPNLTGLRALAGRSMLMAVTGADSGWVWGTDTYTDDSLPGAAAVHAGLVKPGERRLVRVRFLPGQAAYGGSKRNGIASRSYAAFGGSFRMEAADAPGGGGAAAAAGVDPTPDGTPTGLRGRDGATVLVELTGRAAGSIWGDGAYTDDSPLATAAVHAGVLRDGQPGFVRVVVRPGRASYPGVARNGVTSMAYGAFPGSYEFLDNPPRQRAGEPPQPATPADDGGGGPGRGPGADAALPAAPDLRALRDKVGQAIYVKTTGTTNGIVWGADDYTDDSAVDTAAVHAGALRAGETGIVRVTVGAARAEFGGSTRNGVTSQAFGAWGGSFRVERAGDDVKPGTLYHRDPTPAPDGRKAGVPGTQDDGDSKLPVAPNLQSFRGKVGTVIYVKLTGSSNGIVWGTDAYTDDSPIDAAAVHAGALRDGERGVVKVTVGPPQARFEGAARNGVTSQPFGAWDGSFRVERAGEGVRPPTLYYRAPSLPSDGARGVFDVPLGAAGPQNR